MAISNYTLKRIYLDYKSQLEGVKISKIVKISNNDFSFILYSKKQESLIISLEPLHPYFLLSSSYFKTLNETNTFVTSLKKYFENGVITSLTKVENDRILIMEIKKVTATYQTIVNKLIIELIPHRTNAIIVDQNNIIISALKMSSSLDDKHLIARGVHYKLENEEDKTISKDDTLETLKTKVGLTLYKDILYRMENEEAKLEDIIDEILTSDSYYAYNNDILSIPLHSFKSEKISLDQLSKIYEEKENEKYKKNHFDLVFHLVKHKLKGLRNKVVKLDKELIKAKEKESYVEIGNLLYMGEEIYQKGMTEIEIEGVKIALDPRLDLKENAKRYFKQYQKSKVALLELVKQKDLALDKIDFFEKIENQIAFASLEDMEDIIEELKLMGYIKDNKKKRPNPKKKKIEKIYKPRIIQVDGYKIGYGLSSFQNDYLTFTLAKKDDYFLHVKDSHGPHVIIFSNDPSEEALLTASEISLYLAGKTTGDIYLADKKDVKKISGQLGKVTINKYQTIHLDEIRKETIELVKKGA